MPRRGSLIVAATLACALVAAGCGVSRESAADGPAGEVSFPDGNSYELSGTQVRGSVAEIEAAPEFKATVFAGATDPQITASIAQIAVVETFFTEIQVNEDVELTEDDQTAGEEAVSLQFGNMFASPEIAEENLAAVPLLRDLLVKLEAQQVALLDHFAVDGEQYPCVRHILVESQDEADDLVTQISDGGDFAALATEFSIDTGSGAAGGELGCVPTTQWVPEFAAAVDGGEQNELLGPVESDFGFHIIEVTGFEGDGNAGLQEAYQAVSAEAIVTLEPDIGTWDPTTSIVQPIESAEDEAPVDEAPVEDSESTETDE